MLPKYLHKTAFGPKEIISNFPARRMVTEVMLQVAILLLTLGVFFAVQYLPKQALGKLRHKNRDTLQTNRHLVQGSHLLARARSTTNRAHSQSLAKTALTEAETAISLAPKDPACHILKALALDLLDHKRSALRSLDLALSSPRVRSLADKDRGDALVKRAEMKIAVNRRRRIDSAIEDLKEATRLSQGSGNSRAFRLLGECYELKGVREKAWWAYKEASRIEPKSVTARERLDRLGS